MEVTYGIWNQGSGVGRLRSVHSTGDEGGTGLIRCHHPVGSVAHGRHPAKPAQDSRRLVHSEKYRRYHDQHDTEEIAHYATSLHGRRIAGDYESDSGEQSE